jgi:membrane protein
VLAFIVLRRATANFLDDRATQMAAGISYFALFSLFPFTLLVFSVFGLVLRDEDLKARVLDAIVDGIPVEAGSVEDALVALADQGTTIGLVALLGTLWSASALATALRSALNVAFEVEQRRPLVRGKLIDFTILPALGLLFLGSLVLTTVWRVAQAEVDDLGVFGELTWLWELGAIGIAGLSSFLAFLFLYWLLPNGALRLRFLWPGALVAAVGFEAAKLGFTLYLANFGNYDAVYGSLGGVIVFLFWVYLSANIMLFGAEVAAEVPHVLHGEARHGHEGAPDVGWRESVVMLLRGLIFGPAEASPEPEPAALAAAAREPEPSATAPEDRGAAGGA